MDTWTLTIVVSIVHCWVLLRMHLEFMLYMYIWGISIRNQSNRSLLNTWDVKSGNCLQHFPFVIDNSNHYNEMNLLSDSDWVLLLHQFSIIFVKCIKKYGKLAKSFDATWKSITGHARINFDVAFLRFNT